MAAARRTVPRIVIARRTDVPIFFAQFEAQPTPSTPEFEVCGGAYINCWVGAESPSAAQTRAFASISQNGWAVVRVEEPCQEATDAWYEKDEENRGYFEQARIDGEVYVYHHWPHDSGESEDVH